MNFFCKKINKNIPGNKEKVISSFEEESKKIREFMEYSTTITFCHNNYRKKLSSSVSLSSLREISIKDLEVGKIHRGCYIKGVLCVSPVPMAGINSIIEDKYGDIIYISFYNLISDVHWQSANAIFPKLTNIIILEPFYKLRNDGTLGIRVDDPNDVVFDEILLDSSSTSLTKLNEEGLLLFKERKFSQALVCYDKCLTRHQEQNENITLALLLNISYCSLNLFEYEQALLYSFAASILLKHHPNPHQNGFQCKANFRIFQALASLKTSSNNISEAWVWYGNELKQFQNSFIKHDSIFQRFCNDNNNPSSLNYDDVLMILIQLILSPLKIFVSDVQLLSKSDTLQGSITENKEHANKLFTNKQYVEAKKLYLLCLIADGKKDSSNNLCSILLRNQGQCYIALQDIVAPLPPAPASSNKVFGLVYTITSLCVDINSEKAWYRLCKCFLESDSIENAETVISIALKIFVDSQKLNLINKKILLAKNQNVTTANNINKTEKSFLTEKDLSSNPDYASPEGVKLINQMVQLVNATKTSKDMKKNPANSFSKNFDFLTLDNRVIPFHIEFFDRSLLLNGCDEERCYKVLDNLYELARSQNLHKFHLIQEETSIEDLNKRWHLKLRDENFRNWYLSDDRKFGDVTFFSLECTRYSAHILQSFSNSIYRAEKQYAGTVHVSIGFVDLCSLIYSDIVDPSNLSKEKPFRWIGYEMSPYCVAKSLVIAEMMRNGSHGDSILQVWYSAVWNKKTLKEFYKSLETVIATTASKISMDASLNDVHIFLTHWMTHSVSLERARTKWLDSQTDQSIALANFKRKSDVLAICSYLLTGQLLQGDVGSIVMFENPLGYGELALNLNFLQTIKLSLLVKEWQLPECTNIIEAGIKIVLKRIEFYLPFIQQNFINISINIGNVTHENKTLCNEIKCLNPYAISWSNVPDYFHPKDFFVMAKACSASTNTVHVFYTMNWTSCCFGSHIFDHASNQRLLMNERSINVISEQYNDLNYDKMLMLPPLDNIINTSSYILSIGFANKWAEAFFKYGNIDSKNRNTDDIQSYNPLARTQGSLYMIFTFDKSLTLTHNI